MFYQLFLCWNLKFVLYYILKSPFSSEIVPFQMAYICSIVRSPYFLFNWKVTMLEHIPAISMVAHCGVKFFLILENMYSSSALLWMMHNVICKSLKSFNKFFFYWFQEYILCEDETCLRNSSSRAKWLRP